MMTVTCSQLEVMTRGKLVTCVCVCVCVCVCDKVTLIRNVHAPACTSCVHTHSCT